MYNCQIIQHTLSLKAVTNIGFKFMLWWKVALNALTVHQIENTYKYIKKTCINTKSCKDKAKQKKKKTKKITTETWCGKTSV